MISRLRPVVCLLILRYSVGTDAIVCSCPLVLIISSYLTCRNELQWAQRALHVRDVGFELIEGGSDVGLDLGRFLPRWAVGRDLVERLLRHSGGNASCEGVSR